MADLAELKRSRRLSDREMDEVIERASRLQERARAGDSGRSVADVKEVGRELDIDDRFVDLALEEMRAEREASAQAQRRRSALAKKLVAAALAAVVLAGGAGWLGTSGVREAQAQTQAAQGALDVVLERQSALVPQLVGLAGGEITTLAALQRKLREAQDPQARAAAADELAAAMAVELGKLPAPADPSQAQQRLSLQHELVGAQNRITVERRRVEEARDAWRRAATGPLARLGIALGFADAP